MKCEVVRDLIPLYDEKLCSPESAAIVEEHIKSCSQCRALLDPLPKREIPKADSEEIKPFVKIRRKLRKRYIGLIVLGVVLLAVLIPVGYLTVNQIFHINGGTDFEDIIYKYEIGKFGGMITEGRMEEYVQRYENLYLCDAPDGTEITYRSFYLDKLKKAYENVKKYDPRIKNIRSDYFKGTENGGFHRLQSFYLEFTGADGSVYSIPIITENYEGLGYGVPDWSDPRLNSTFITADRNFFEWCYALSESDIPTDLREIYAFVNALYLADGGDMDINWIESLQKTTDPLMEGSIEALGNLLAIHFTISDYRSVYDGFSDLMNSNYMLNAAVGGEQFDGERNMFYYPVTLVGSYEEQQAVVMIKLYFDEYGFRSPRPEDIRGITENSDLEKKLAKIFG